MQRTRQPIHARRKAQVGITQRRSHQVSRMRTHIASLMISMDGHI